MDFSGLLLETIRESVGDRLERGRNPADGSRLLVRSAPVHDAAALASFRWEMELGDVLASNWALRPKAFTADAVRGRLIVEDPGGLPLDLVLRRPPGFRQLLRLAAGIARALSHAHAAGLIHKSIRPAHVWVTGRGGVRLTGFGLASRAPRDQAGPSASLLSPTSAAYIAPERTGRMNRSVDQRSDLYALGVTLFELFAGTLPFRASDAREWLHSHVARAPARLAEGEGGVPPLLAGIVAKLLEKNPEDRYQTAAGVHYDLRRLASALNGAGADVAFPLAERDVPRELLLPEKLYGREAEVERLLAAYHEAAAAGRSGMTLVSGHSGAGKTALVEELRTRLYETPALFASGKFDQYGGGTPYATLAAALRGLVNHVLDADPAKLPVWRASVQEAVGSSGQLLFELVPELELLIGAQAGLPRFAPQEALVRFHAVFARFLAVFAQPDHPLVLFLDDVQWSDAATLDLVTRLVGGEETPFLFVIAAHRGLEIPPESALLRMVEAVRTARGDLLEIRLEPLDVGVIATFLADALRARVSTVRPIAEVIHRKTQGNPFFTRRFVEALAAEGLLAFSPAEGRWSWDLEAVRRKEISATVADLMAETLARWDGPTLELLKHMACLGLRADYDTLLRTCALGQMEIDRLLPEPLAAGLLHRSERGYAFAHDRIRQSAYELIAPADRGPLHGRIGAAFLAAETQPETSERLFELLDHLNRSAPAGMDDAERRRLARLNLAAGERAKEATAYDAALGYLRAGLELIARLGHSEEELDFQLRFHCADCRFMLGEISELEGELEVLAARAKTVSDVGLVLGRRVLLNTFLVRIEPAVTLSLDCLRRFGVEFPLHPTQDEVEREYDQLLAELDGRGWACIERLSSMTDPHWLEVMPILGALVGPAAVYDFQLMLLVCMRTARISLAWGNTDDACHAYANLGGIYVAGLLNEFESGTELARIAVRLVEEQGFNRYAARVKTLVASLILPYCMPLREAARQSYRATELGAEQGGLTHSGWAWSSAVCQMLDSGENLANVEGACAEGRRFNIRKGFALGADFISGTWRLSRALQGRTSALHSFDEDGFDQTDYIATLDALPHQFHNISRFNVRRLQLLTFAEKWEDALATLTYLEGRLSPTKVFEVTAEYWTFSSIVVCEMLDRVPPEEAGALSGLLERHDAALRQWAERCPENFACRAALVAAERARRRGDELDAERLFEEAISSAAAEGFVQIEALASERAARFQAARGFRTIAAAYLRQARDAYARWGATAKVAQLDATAEPREGAERSRHNAAEAGRGLDLDAVVSMHQAVSSEIVLDRLIERLLTLMVEHAGAGRGLLLLAQEGGLRPYAEATVDGPIPVVTMMDDGAETHAPFSVLNPARRSLEPVIIDDALYTYPYAADAYVRNVRPRSVLCLPLVKQQGLIGILYLENRFVAGLFSQKRMSVLRLLASQAAISLENAVLFRDLSKMQEQARQTSEELRRALDTMPFLAWSADADGGMEFANRQWETFTGLRSDQFAADWISAWHPEDRVKTLGRWRAILKSGAPAEIEARLMRADGESRHCLLRAAPLRDHGGDIVKWYGGVIDIEDIRRAEQAQEALARVSRITALGELTVSIAHEINQPLMAITTNAATCVRWLSRDHPNVEEAKLAAERIVKDGHRAGDVIAGIRTLARKASPSVERMDLNEALAQVLSLVRSEIERSGITVSLDFDATGAGLLGDRVQIEQVALNLVVNAVEAMNSVSGVKRLSLHTRHGDGGLVLEVSDTGVGLQASTRDRIFEPFYTTKSEGVGMGLSICRSILEAHGGRIWVSPNKPRGTIMHVALPCEQEDRAHARSG